MTPVENNGLSVDRLIEKGFDPQRKRRVPVPVRLVAALAALIGLGTGVAASIGACECWNPTRRTLLHVAPVAGVSLVGYESDNRITNAGADPWKKETGLLSIWILGMFKPSPATTIVVPIRAGKDADLGAKVTSDYFGAVPATGSR